MTTNGHDVVELKTRLADDVLVAARIRGLLVPIGSAATGNAANFLEPQSPTSAVINDLLTAGLYERDGIAADVLNPLTQYEESRRSGSPDLRQTLTLCLDERSPGVVAKALYVHRHTIKSHLQNVEALFGAGSLDDPESLLLIRMALAVDEERRASGRNGAGLTQWDRRRVDFAETTLAAIRKTLDITSSSALRGVPSRPYAPNHHPLLHVLDLSPEEQVERAAAAIQPLRDLEQRRRLRGGNTADANLVSLFTVLIDEGRGKSSQELADRFGFRHRHSMTVCVNTALNLLDDPTVLDDPSSRWVFRLKLFIDQHSRIAEPVA